MSSAYSSQSRTRPLGVTILCFVAGFGALRSLVTSLGILGSPTLFSLLGLVGVALAIGKLTILYGLWTLRAWGQRWAVAIYTVSALLNLGTFGLLGLLFDGAIVLYLVSKADHFR